MTGTICDDSTGKTEKISIKLSEGERSIFLQSVVEGEKEAQFRWDRDINSMSDLIIGLVSTNYDK